MQALHYYERALCPGGCGQPAHVAHDERLKDDWSQERLICHACAALRGGPEKKGTPPGELQWVEFDLGWARTFPSGPR